VKQKSIFDYKILTIALLKKTFELKPETPANTKKTLIKSKQIYVTTPVSMDLELPKILREHQVEVNFSKLNRP
jgi:hypothetical protein